MDIQPYLAPLPGDNPAGQDSRYEPEYAALLAEIEKLNSITQTEECDWGAVEANGLAVLRDKAKDFQVASYVSYALTRLHGLEGLRDGALLIAGLVEAFWETGFPVLRRLRGRVNALDWWRERVQAALDAELGKEGVLHDPEAVRSLREALDNLDRVLADRVPDFPSLRSLLERVDRLPLKEAAIEAPAASQAPPAQEAQAAPEAPRDAPAASAAEPVQPQAPAQKAEPPRPQESAPEATGTAATTGAGAAQAPQAAPAVRDVQRLTPPPAQSENARENAEAFTAYCLAFAESARTADLSDPLPWMAARMGRFGRLRALPPAQDGQTALPAPSQEERDALLRLFEAGRHEQAARACENFWPGHPFWLDAQRLVATCLERLGFAQAANAVTQACVLLLRQLPGVERLAFNDGTPFADAETLAWLASLQSAGDAEETRVDPADAAVATARRLFGENRRGEALDTLDSALSTLADPKGRFTLRVEQCRLLLRCGENAAAALLGGDLVGDADNARLDLWDRGLALEAALVTRRALLELGTEDARGRARDLEHRILRLKSSALLEG